MSYAYQWDTFLQWSCNLPRNVLAKSSLLFEGLFLFTVVNTIVWLKRFLSTAANLSSSCLRLQMAAWMDPGMQRKLTAIFVLPTASIPDCEQVQARKLTDPCRQFWPHCCTTDDGPKQWSMVVRCGWLPGDLISANFLGQTRGLNHVQCWCTPGGCWQHYDCTKTHRCFPVTWAWKSNMRTREVQSTGGWKSSRLITS